MIGVVGNNNPAVTAGAETTSTPVNTGGASGPGGILSNEKDAKGKSTDPQFGAILNQMQSQYGAKEEKPREIKKTLGKDDFLRIMITQMKNQDPTSPFKAEQMATEMAQFTSVEQLQNVNQNLAKMTNANQPMEHLAMTNLIGKNVTIDRERFSHTEGQNEALSVNLPHDAAEVKLTVVADNGETVFDKDLGPQKAGPISFPWDGRKTNTLPAKNGTYMLRVEAKDEKGRSLTTNPMSTARVVGVSFEGSEPVFLVGDARSQTKVTLKNIIKIEENGGSPMGSFQMAGGAGNAGPGGASAGGSAPAGEKPGNFFTFQKGVGSANADRIDPETQKALAAYQEAQAAQAQPAASKPAPVSGSSTGVGPAAVAQALGADKEKGFANGLHDGDEPPSAAKTAATNPQSLVQ